MTDESSVARPHPWLVFLRNPLSRIVLYLVMVTALVILMRLLLPIGESTSAVLRLSPGAPGLWLYAFKDLVVIGLPYWVLVRFVEGRLVDEMAPRKLLPNFSAGWLVGTAILVAAAGAMALFGAYTITGINSGVTWFAPLVVVGLLPGITEEIAMRGVLFRVVEDGLGTWTGLFVSALVFGAMHLGNPGATLWSSLAITLEAGLLLGMAYAWTRSLWFVMGLHAAWNFTQGTLLGIHVSGVPITGFVASTTQGNVWLSGGEFGAEASVTTVLICTGVTAFFTWKAIAQKRIRPPFWRRDKSPAIADKSVATAADPL
jgi:membrane protease YdiL (CAAX protease family)